MEFPEGFENLVHLPTVYTSELKFPAPGQILLSDTTLRDGEQCPGVAFNPRQKLEIAKALDDIGIHIIDLGFPATSKSDEEALSLILEAKKEGVLKPETDLLVTCRANRDDVDYALKVLIENAAKPSDVTFFVFTAGSDLQVKYKIGKTLLKREGVSEQEWLKRPVKFYRDANIRLITDIIRMLKDRGVNSIEAGCAEDGSRSDINYLIELIGSVIDAGATRIAFADTIGILTPESSAFYFSNLRKHFPDIPIIAHCHDDYGLATINSLTALSNGATGIACTVNGIGERAGNTALHTVVGSLYALYGVVLPRSRLVENSSGLPLQVNEPIVGKNVFTHESGIHLAGILIDPRIYSHIPPETFGSSSKFIFGKHSGRHAVEKVLRENSEIFEKLGIKLDDDLINRSLKMVKSIRERNQEERSSETIINRYYKVMDMLGISEEKLVELALIIGQKRGW
jgi:isopropylmalate/homocitrate/citramalate synthase